RTIIFRKDSNVLAQHSSICNSKRPRFRLCPAALSNVQGLALPRGLAVSVSGSERTEVPGCITRLGSRDGGGALAKPYSCNRNREKCNGDTSDHIDDVMPFEQ